jgi:hypothetical protein
LKLPNRSDEASVLADESVRGFLLTDSELRTMNALLLPVAVLLAALAGLFFLGSYLWYRHAVRLHAESLFPDDATGVRLLRYGVSTGAATFGGFLLVSVLYLLAGSTAGTTTGPALDPMPFETVAIGLFALSLSTFCVAGVGYAADAIRRRLGVR